MPRYTIEKSKELEKRKKDLKILYSIIFESKEEWPYYMADQATIFDISMDSEDELISKLNIKFEIRLTVRDLKLPLWKLIDKIKKAHIKSDIIHSNKKLEMKS